MVRYFHFHYPEQEHYFNAQLETKRCAQMKDDGLQCKNRVCIGLPYCRVHLKYKHFLCIKESTIPNGGLGVFVCNPRKDENEIIFKKGQRVCMFSGEIITQEVLEERYGNYTAPYALKLKRDVYEDGAKVVGIGALINHKPIAQANCKLSVSGGANGRGQILATKNIKNNSELFVNYGRDYRMNQRGIQFSRNGKKYNI